MNTTPYMLISFGCDMIGICLRKIGKKKDCIPVMDFVSGCIDMVINVALMVHLSRFPVSFFRYELCYWITAFVLGISILDGLSKIILYALKRRNINQEEEE